MSKFVKAEMMKKNIARITYQFALCALPFALLLSGCTERLNAPQLPTVESDVLPAAVAIDEARIAGVWESSSTENRYVVEFTDVADSMAIVSHYYTDATTGMPDSAIQRIYRFSYQTGTFNLTPSSDAAAQGSTDLTAIHTADGTLALYVSHTSGYRNQICLLNRTSGPVPVVMQVNRTLPKAGETVVVSGRNLQNIDHVYLPTATGWQEVATEQITSRSIRFIMPAGEFVQGSIRCQVSEDKLSVYSPAYMFATDGIFMHSFSENGTTKADHYAGSEFEYTIKDLGQLKSNVYTPGDRLCFFGETPIAWPVASGGDDKKGYLRFSSGDRFQAVLDRYVAGGSEWLTPRTPCGNLAIQMDIYVESDGQPVWKTGYISYRLNKDRTEGESSANVAAWNIGEPVSYADGMETYTIPLSAFRMSQGLNIEQFIRTLLQGNLQTIVTVMNYNLSEQYPATALDAFQFTIADLRLVPIVIPENTKE